MIDSKPYLCRHCETPLGLVSDAVLVIGFAAFHQLVTFTCGHCTRRLTWMPTKKENTKQKSMLVSATA